jgi:predicted nucleic acid-binding protein
MQKVVSNSSPLIHLAKIERLDLLKDYFGIISIPEAVYRECVVDGKNREEVELIRGAGWIKVIRVKNSKLVKLLWASLDEGESEAIALSLEVGADLVLLDDYDAREKARLFGLKITGTVGVLLRANKENKIRLLKEELRGLKKTGFWIGSELETRLLQEVGEL